MTTTTSDSASARAPQRLLVMGANGMLGNAVLRWLAADPNFEVFGSVRRPEAAMALRARMPGVNLVENVDASQVASLRRLFEDVKPQVVINCIGVVKQLAGADDPSIAIPINAMLPHRLARLCQHHGARLIHISTDCVFSGSRGAYTEDDEPDADDLYGRSKLMGEVSQPYAVTLRTSIIGHELQSGHGLVGWFTAQTGAVKGFSRAIFSALPTVELARVIQQHVIPHPELSGTYHVGAEAISKYEVLSLVANEYGSRAVLQSDADLVMDRSLISDRFNRASGYQPPSWPELVRRMREFS
ncbi:dTDP-4-dehydrorhamnose reductase [Pelomonas saccharophila]|uniref:dTDP-4-dehydrorhamnose reductase n=1 Tax=Roseateles saccharophilus TaxID=304 RepID=A0ABU1YSM7_ROSSA|nr:SDR family oxidoreductase [Roseateles saccharophilus]MDR7271852.1 dTDP-4-dehydrorhamnose reductase [Roseateles saccharophilus]